MAGLKKLFQFSGLSRSNFGYGKTQPCLADEKEISFEWLALWRHQQKEEHQERM